MYLVRRVGRRRIAGVAAAGAFAALLPPPTLARVPPPAAMLAPEVVRPRAVLTWARTLKLGLWSIWFGVLVAFAHAPVGLELRTKAAEAAVEWLEVAGPLFVKLGQWLSCRRDFFSAHICTALGRLHTQVHPSFDEEYAREALEAHESCASVELQQRVGCGCIAQVYEGLDTETGRRVAVKIRRPNVEENIEQDLVLLSTMRLLVDYWSPSQVSWMGLEEALRTFEGYMMAQTNFENESVNAQKLGTNFSRHAYIRTPEVHYSSRDVLVMDYVDGPTLSHVIAEGGDMFDMYRKEIWNVLGDMMGHMMVRDNFTHSDLHPGNICVVPRENPGELRMPWWFGMGLPPRLEANLKFMGLGAPEPRFELWLLDTGMAIEMSGTSKGIFRGVISGALFKDREMISKAVVEAHAHRCSESTDQRAFGEEISAFLFSSMHDVQEEALRFFGTREEYLSSGVTAYANHTLDIFARHRVCINPEIWSVLTSCCLIESSMRALNDGVNALDCISPYVLDITQGLRRWSAERRETYGAWYELAAGSRLALDA